VEKNFELEKHDPPPLVLAQRNLASAYAGPFKVVFKPDDKERDVCVMMKNMMQLLGFTSAVAITSSRFARMEERQLTNEFKLRGFPYPFNLGIACELHPWLDIRIFYQHGPADDKEYIGIGSSRVKRDVMYRNHIERLKYGDLSEWPPRYREYFPKPS
jgi:hypothetical protein